MASSMRFLELSPRRGEEWKVKLARYGFKFAQVFGEARRRDFATEQVCSLWIREQKSREARHRWRHPRRGAQSGSLVRRVRKAAKIIAEVRRGYPLRISGRAAAMGRTVTTKLAGTSPARLP